jgi:hypothetical protein
MGIVGDQDWRELWRSAWKLLASPSNKQLLPIQISIDIYQRWHYPWVCCSHCCSVMIFGSLLYERRRREIIYRVFLILQLV